jgi:hypothetical protein
MTFTRIDCDIFRGKNAQRETSAHVLLNPKQEAGSIAFAAAGALRSGLGSQLACTLSLERFREGVLSYFWELDQNYKPKKIVYRESAVNSQLVLEQAFKQANTAVYNFAHNLAAGGKLAATVMGGVLDGNSITVGRVGKWSAYLARENFLYPFFDESQLHEEVAELGSQVAVNVETTNVELESKDVIFIFSNILTDIERQRLLELLPELHMEIPQICRHVVEYVFDNSEDLNFALCSKIGPRSIYLKEVLK